MQVSFIEEERIRTQLKHLLEDDEKRKRGVFAVLKRDRQLAKDWTHLNDTYSYRNNMVIVNQMSQLRKPKSKLNGVKMNNIPVIDMEKKPTIHKPKPTVKRLLKSTNAINSINASLEAYNSRLKANAGNNKVNTNSSPATGLAKSLNSTTSGVTKIQQPTETTKRKAIRKIIPRSNSSIDKSNSKVSVSPSSLPLLSNSSNPSSGVKKIKKSSSVFVSKAVKPPISSNLKTRNQTSINNINISVAAKPQIKSAKPMIPKNSYNTDNNADVNSMSLKKPMLPKKNSKIMERTLPQVNKFGGKVINKKSLKSNHSVNVEAKEKPLSGRSRQKLTSVPPKSKSSNATNIKKPREDITSTLVQIGKVKAIVEKIKSLSTSTSRPEENLVSAATNEKGKVVTKKVPSNISKSFIEQPLKLNLPKPFDNKPNESEENKLANSEDDGNNDDGNDDDDDDDDDFCINDDGEEKTSNDNEKDEKSKFDIDTKELQGLIKDQIEMKKSKVEPKYYSMKGFFGERSDEMCGVPNVESDSDMESSVLYSDSEVSSNYTLQDHQPDVSSNDDSLLLDTIDLDETDSNDPDYVLPKEEVEDLVIHKGSASIRDLIRDENKLFDSDDDETKIVEIPQKNRSLKPIKQPKAYCKEELMKLTVYTTAASSSEIRKRHLALKSENNDLQSQKSVSKMKLRSKKRSKTSNSKSKVHLVNETKVDQNEEVKTKEPKISKKSKKEENPPKSLTVVDNEDKPKEEDIPKSTSIFGKKVQKIDSCPLFSLFTGNNNNNKNEKSDFGIPTIRSAEPKFNIFKSQASIDNEDEKMQVTNSEDDDKEECPQLIKIESEISSSKSDLNKQNGKNILNNSSNSNSESDTASVVSVDVNEKYLYNMDDYRIKEDKIPKIPIAVIDATQCLFEASANETEAMKSKLDTNTTSIGDKSIKPMDIESNEYSEVLTNLHQASEQNLKINILKKIKSTNPFDEDEVDEENLESLEKSTQISNPSAQNHLRKPSTNPFDEDEDLITFSDDIPIAAPSALKKNPDNLSGLENIFKTIPNEKQENIVKNDNEIYVDNLVNNNLNQCIMYSIQTPNTLNREKLGDKDFQFVRYAPNDEPNDPDNPNNTEFSPITTQNSSSSSSSNVDSNASDNQDFDDSKTIRDPYLTNKILKDPLEKILRKEYLNVHINSLVSRKVLLLLRNPIYIYGTVRLTVLIGTVEVFGYRAGPGESLEIFSPKGFSLLQIVPLCHDDLQEYEEDYVRDCLQNVKDHFTTLDLRNMRRFFVAKTDAIIVLHRNHERAKLTQNFKFFMNENVFPKIKSFNSKPPFGGSEHLLNCRILPETDQALKVPHSWTNFSLFNNKRVIVAGGKGVGKSTFVRYIINKHLAIHEKILLIDLDIGQPEIFVPQTVSYTVIKKPLLGPGFFLNKQPHKAYVVGHTNVVMCPMVYKNAVKSLIQECHSNEYLKDLPWMVNTMGYNKGFGTELMAMIAELVQPTDMVQFESPLEINNFDIPLGHKNLITQPPRFIDDTKGPGLTREILPYTLHKLPSISSDGNRYKKAWAMSAKDIRYSMIIARLSDALYGEAQMLTDCKPLWISFHKIHLFNAVTNYQNKSELLRTIEGNLVYLGNYVDDVKPIECYGIGVVRAVDFQTERLYLVPAMPYEYMYYVNCLVIGEMCLPATVFKNQGYKITHNVPFVFETDDNKASKAIKQIFHRPSEFLLSSKQSFDA